MRRIREIPGKRPSGRAGVVLALAALLAGAGAATDRLVAPEVLVVSPDGAVRFEVSLHEGRLSYAVTFKGRPVIERSPLVVTVDGVDITQGVAVAEVKRYRVKESYPWR